MTDDGPEEIEKEMLRAVESHKKWVMEGRVLNFKEVIEHLQKDSSCHLLAEYFKKKGFFIVDQPRSEQARLLER